MPYFFGAFSAFWLKLVGMILQGVLQIHRKRPQYRWWLLWVGAFLTFVDGSEILQNS